MYYSEYEEVTKAQKESIRPYFTMTPSQKQQMCQLCGWRIKLSAFDVIEALVAHFRREHTAQWENIRITTGMQADQSTGYRQEFQSPYGAVYGTGMEVGSNLEDSRSLNNYDNYYESYNNYNSYQNYQPAFTPAPYDNSNAHQWQSEYNYEWNNPALGNMDLSNYERIRDQSQLMEESHLNSREYGRKTPGNLYEDFDNYDGYDNYAPESNNNDDPLYTRFVPPYEESIDGHAYAKPSTLFKPKSKHRDKEGTSNRTKNIGATQNNILDATANNYNINMSAIRNGKPATNFSSPSLPLQQPGDQMLTNQSARQTSKQLAKWGKAKVIARPENVTLLPNEKNITYPTLIGIKNRPASFVSKVNQQFYFETPEFLPNISKNSMVYYQLFSKQSKQTQATKQFFRNIDLALNKQSAVAMAKTKLALQDDQATQLIEQYWWGGRDYEEIGLLLSKRGINFRQSQDRNSIVITQRNILQDYLRYGDCVYVVSYNQLVSLRRAHEPAETLHNAYIFFVADSRSELIFVSLALTKTNSSANLLQMLEMFYGSMHGFVSNSIVVNFTSANASANQQAQKELREAVSMFENNYLSSWKIGLSFNDPNSLNNLGAELKEIKQKELLKIDFNIQIQKQYDRLENQLEKLVSIWSSQQQQRKGLSQASQYLQKLKVRIKTHNTQAELFQKHHPKAGAAPTEKGYIFVGIINKRKEVESLYRKMHLIIKSMEPKTLPFAELVGSVWRVNRHLKKIGKQVELDYRLDYRKYRHKCMYKLHKKLGSKIFNILQQNYLSSLKLKLTHISPTIIEVHEPCSSQSNFAKTITFSLTYLLASDYWICNCWKLQETGIPCRHLIAVVLFYGGQVQHYLNDRWLLCKTDKERLKKFRQKQTEDQD